MASTVEEIVNMALEVINYPSRIGDIYDGSPAARAALDIYRQTRDEVMQVGDWPFAFREIALMNSGQTPPKPWAFEFLYPADCLRIRYMRHSELTGGGRDFDPVPILFQTWNDTRPNTGEIKAILCEYTPPVTLLYVGRVINPALWEPGYTQALVDDLAKKLAFRLQNSSDIIRARIGLAQQSVGSGLMVNDMIAPELPMVAAAAAPQQQAR